MKLRTLTALEKTISHRVISAYAFYGLVVDALLNRAPLSVIRVSDGEKGAIDYATSHDPNSYLLCFDEGFRKKFGCDGISCGEFLWRINSAVEKCSYFAPTLGFFNPVYYTPFYFPERRHYVDELYQYHWSKTMKMELARAAGEVVVINRESQIVDKMQSILPDVKFIHVPLSNWDEASEALETTTLYRKAPLVLMSAALASKWIGPVIAAADNKVVLDIGQAADVWFD